MRRWTAAYTFRYSPIISFERRRLALLDWVERSVDPISFRDDSHEVGFSLTRGVRIRIDRRSVTLEDSIAAKDGVESLWPMLDGLLEIMEPRDIEMAFASVAWSRNLRGWSYGAATQALAAQVTGLRGPLPSGITATDVAPLVDFTSDNLVVQAEYGVVSPPELRDRLNNPDVGKIKGRPGGEVDKSALEGLSDTLLFVDTTSRSYRAELLSDKAGMQAAVHEFEAATREVADAIVATALTEKEIVK